MSAVSIEFPEDIDEKLQDLVERTGRNKSSCVPEHIAKRITSFLRKRVALLDDPRSIGEALSGPNLGQL